MRSIFTEHMQHYAPGNIDATVEAALAALGKEHALFCVPNELPGEKTAFWHATS
jgi:hypothetical protein